MKLAFSLVLLLTAMPIFAGQNFEPPSFGSMGLPKKVIGTYPRSQITDSSDFIYRIVGQIEVGCTGTLIGPKHIITAGHCVYNAEDKSWYNNLNFYPGRTGENEIPYGVVGWKKVMIQKEYLDSGDTAYDFAVIELEEPIGDKIGWSGFKVLPEAEYTNNVRITGYPGDKDKGTMWTVTCPSSVSGTGIFYKCDTYGGMSGSSVYSINQDPEQTLITSVHTWGDTDTNGGVIIDSKNFNLIQSWKNDSTYSDNTIVHDKEVVAARNYDRFFFQNNCYLPVRAYLHYLDIDNTWKSDGPWTMAPGDKIYVADTRNRTYYFAALSTDGEKVWKGDQPITMNDGNVFYMIQNSITTDEFGDWTQALTCD